MKLQPGIMLLAATLIAACSAEQPATKTAQPVAETATPAESSPAAAVSNAEEDPITALCLDMMTRYSREVSACGTMSFRASAENADTYADMASYYLNSTDPDASLAERWDQVVDVVLADSPGNKREMSNALGKAHRAALKTCAS